MTDRQIQAVAEKIVELHNWCHARAIYNCNEVSIHQAKAAIEASDAKYVPALVKAIEQIKTHAASTNNIIERKCKTYEICQKALAQVPEEYRR